MIIDDDARENFGDNGSLTRIHGGDIGRIKFGIEPTGDVERLKLIGDVEDESAFVCRIKQRDECLDCREDDIIV